MGLLTGKRALVVGVANDRSIAAGIAGAMRREGAELAFTYQNDRLRERVEKIADGLGSKVTLPCEVSNDKEIRELFTSLEKRWRSLDILVHSVAYAPREQLDGDYLQGVTREGFLMAHDISSYSFSALGEAARPMMQGRDAAMLTLTYIGAVKAMPNYNVMGGRQGKFRGQRALHGFQPGPGGHTRQCDFSGTYSNPCRLGHQGPEGISQPRRTSLAAPSKRYHRGSRQRGRLPVLRLRRCGHRRITYVDCGYNISGII